jgi:hypothetical protein
VSPQLQQQRQQRPDSSQHAAHTTQQPPRQPPPRPHEKPRLGLYFVIGAIAWTTFIYNGIPVPDSFATILATIAGGLVGVLAPTAGPARSSEPTQEGRPPPPAE